MPNMPCATRRSRSSTEYSFLSNPTLAGAWKSISGTPPGEVEDFLIFRMFQIRTKSFRCACMTGIKLNIRASRWNWDPRLKVFYFIKLEKKSIHQERLCFLIRYQNASIRWFLVDAAYKNFYCFYWKILEVLHIKSFRYPRPFAMYSVLCPNL